MRTYLAFGAPFQGRTSSQTARFVAALALSLSTAACGSISLPLGPQAAGPDITSSMAAAAPASGLAVGDLSAMSASLADAAETGATPIAWSNPESGSQGTITNIAAMKGPDGTPCRTFSTLVNAVDGVRALRGVACRQADGTWSVDGLAPALTAAS